MSCVECSSEPPGHTRHTTSRPISWPTLARHVPLSRKREVFGRYGVLWAERWRYDLDHLVPLCLGGTNEAINLWPHAWDSAHPPRLKMRLERRLVRHVKRGMIALKQAQWMLMSDWIAAFHLHFGHPPRAGTCQILSAFKPGMGPG